MEVSQFVSGFMDGDAISNYAVELQKVIQSWGHNSKIYGIARHVNTIVPGRCIDVDQYPNRPDDVVIFHFSVGSEMTDYFKKFSGKKILIYHNITPPEYFHYVSEEKATVLREGRRQLKELASVPDLSLAVSEYNASELIQAGFKNPKVFPLLLNIEDLNIKPRKRIFQQYKKEGMNILFVGRVAPNKKIDDVILSFYYVKRLLDPKAKLFIVGAFAGMDSYLGYLRGIIKELDLLDVFFTSHIAQFDLVAYYSLADVFVCMSEHEGFCIPLLEAMYFGVPILAYDSTGVPGTLGGSGVLVKEKDYASIAEMIYMLKENQDLRASIIEGQRVRLKDFDPHRWSEEFKKYLTPYLTGTH